MNTYYQKLLPNNIYHLFSRAVGSEKLLLTPDNYFYFLNKLKQHTSSVCKIFCYTLLPNHFHIVAKIENEESIARHFKIVKKKAFNPAENDISDFIMERFSNLLNSYTKAFNKRESRKGALFMDYMRRSIVSKESDFTTYVWYVHKNAVHHQLTKKVGDWPFDSYQILIGDSTTHLLRNDIVQWFGNKDLFIDFPQQEIQPKINIQEV
ncbi:MAG TPA: hypothetical protein PLP06_05050 [Saprospiraceae bacterium]|nr:hypothetical protein [Saprospiraceae bacterium]